MTTADTPLVSVIVRSMDRPELSGALASLACQTCKRLEILVVDATGGRHRPLPKLPLRDGHSMRLVSLGRPLPRPHAANAGIDAVSGDYFTFLDDDDSCAPEHVATLLEAAAAFPDRLVVYGSTQILAADGSVERIFGNPFNRAMMHCGPLFFWQASLIRTRVRDLGCRVEESLDICEDRDFLAQIAEHSDFAFVPGATFRYRPEAGTSGTGGGTNRDDGRRLQFDALLRARWAGPRAYHLERVTRWCRRAIDAYSRGDRPSAERWFRHALAHYPDDPNALHGLGRLWFEAGDPASAVAAVRRAIEINPRVPEYHWTMALILEARGEIQGAAAAATQAKHGSDFADQAVAMLLRLGAPAALSERLPKADRPVRIGLCPCGSGHRYKHCCGRLQPWSRANAESEVPAIDAALREQRRGEMASALRWLEMLAARTVSDARSANRVAALYACAGVPLRAVEFQRRAVELDEDVESRRLLDRYCDMLYEPERSASAYATAATLLARPGKPASSAQVERLHIVATLGAVGGAENRAFQLHRLLAPHADVTLWLVTPPHVAHATRGPVREIDEGRGEIPDGGTVVFVGTHFEYGDWVHRLRADRVIICHNIDLPVELVQRLTQLAENPRNFPVELTFPTERFRQRTKLRGTVEPSPLDIERFTPRPRRRREGRSLVVGRHSRDDPRKHHPNDPSFYRRLVGLGHRCRILGGLPLQDAFAGDGATPRIELLPAGAEDPRALLATLDCFLVRNAPTLYETGGTAILEAMAMALPVIVFDENCGAVEWIEPGHTGFVVRTEEEALDTVGRLAADPELRESVGEAARRHVLALAASHRASVRRFYLENTRSS